MIIKIIKNSIYFKNQYLKDSKFYCTEWRREEYLGNYKQYPPGPPATTLQVDFGGAGHWQFSFYILTHEVYITFTMTKLKYLYTSQILT